MCSLHICHFDWISFKNHVTGKEKEKENIQKVKMFWIILNTWHPDTITSFQILNYKTNLLTFFDVTLCLLTISDIFFLCAINSSLITLWLGPKILLPIPPGVVGEPPAAAAATKSAASGLDNILDGVPRLPLDTIGEEHGAEGLEVDRWCWWRLIKLGTTLSSKCSMAMEEMSRSSWRAKNDQYWEHIA